MKKNTEKKNRFNIIDFMLIVAALACIIGITIRYNLKETIVLQSDNDTATVTVMVRGLLKSNVDHLVVDDEFYNQRNGELMGTMTDVQIQPAKIRNLRHDGTIAITEYVDRIDAICTIKMEGNNSEEGFYIGGIDYIGCGSSFLVRSVNLETEWLVVDIEVKENPKKAKTSKNADDTEALDQ